MVLKNDFTAEQEFQFFENAEFETLEGLHINEHSAVIVRNLLRLLMMGWSSSWKQLLTLPIIHAIFISHNSELSREMRLAFQKGFFDLFKQLDGIEFNANNAEQLQLYLSNCLCFLPFSDATAYESFSIPQLLNNKIELIEYIITPIELTESTTADSDKVYAYGLTPFSHTQAESHLIFMGTTYPAGQGFFTQLSNDIKGFETVGKSLYRSGRDRIHSWLSHQPNSVHVCGTSLGGSLSLLLAIDKGNYQISRVDALNPAGLHDARNKSRLDYWDTLLNKPVVIIQKQANDPVSGFGIWKSDWDIVIVTPPSHRKGPNLLWDHALNYAGFKGTRFSYIEANADNLARRSRNFWFYSIIRAGVYYSVLLPYSWFVRKASLFFFKHKFALVGAVPLMIHLALCVLFPHMLILSFLILSVPVTIAAILHLQKLQPHVQKIHDPALPRNKTMDIYAEENQVSANFSHAEIFSYYQCIRKIKNKPYLPEHSSLSKYTNVKKSELLQLCEKSNSSDTKVQFRISKAKYFLMKNSLFLMSKYKDNTKLLEQHVSASYENYQVGKSKPCL